jgi:hypothetical protein
MSPAPEPLPPPRSEPVASPAAPPRVCANCSKLLTRLGPHPFRTGGVPGHPDAVLWLDTYWCPSCGKVAFFTVP